MMSFRFLVLTLILLAIASCRKDDAESPTPGCAPCTPTLYDHLFLSIDSACITTGNVITPNADGINDVLAIIALNVTDVQVQLNYYNGPLIYAGDHTGLFTMSLPGPPVGDPPLRLSLQVQGMSLSGNLLEGSTVIYSVTVPQEQCFTSSVAPVTGDQFTIDGLQTICEPLSPTNDQFCIL